LVGIFVYGELKWSQLPLRGPESDFSLIAEKGSEPICAHIAPAIFSRSILTKGSRFFGARPWHMLFTIILPAIAQDALTGIRLAVGVAWIVPVPAEFPRGDLRPRLLASSRNYWTSANQYPWKN
jgi:hypothetical protein